MEPGAAKKEILEHEDTAAAFRDVPETDQGRVLLQLPEPIQQDILHGLDDTAVRRIIRHLDSDEATDIVQQLGATRRENILAKLNAAVREKIETLLRFHPETAAGVMDLDYITVRPDATFHTVSERVARYEEKTGRFPVVLVMGDGALLGELPGRAMAAQESGDEPIADHVIDTPEIHYDAPDREVVDTFRQHPHGKVVVVDDGGSVLGVIHSDDILRIIEEDAGETLYDFTGVSKEENVLDGPLQKVKHRYRWLIVNLGTAFLAASVVGLFEQTIAAFTLLAVYMPIVAGMGGNAGTQTMAVVVRGIALDEVSRTTGRRIIANEIIAGAVNGAINGVLVGIIALVWNTSPMLGLVIGVSMVLNLVIAGFFGATIPIVLDRLGQDPAKSATIFITTATDVLGFFIFLGLASIVL